MTRKAATNALVSELEPTLRNLGWELLRSQSRFQSSDSPVRRVFYFAIQDVLDATQFRPLAGIRVDSVENALNRVMGTDPKFAQTTLTGSKDISRLAGDKDQYRVRIGAEENVRQAATRVLEAFREFAVPFYEKYSTLEQIDTAFNEYPEKECPINIHPAGRAIRGILVASVSGRNSALPSLVQSYRNVLASIDGGVYCEDLEKFLAGFEKAKTSQ